MVLIFKENSPTSCLLICWLTLTEPLRANESLSRTFPQQQMSFSKQQRSQVLPKNLPSLVPLWCFKIVDSGASLRDKEGFHFGKPAAALRGPHRSSSRPSPVHWPGIQGGKGMSVVPPAAAKDVTLSVPTSDCAEVWVLWANLAFPYPHEVV